MHTAVECEVGCQSGQDLLPHAPTVSTNWPLPVTSGRSERLDWTLHALSPLSGLTDRPKEHQCNHIGLGAAQLHTYRDWAQFSGTGANVAIKLRHSRKKQQQPYIITTETSGTEL